MNNYKKVLIIFLIVLAIFVCFLRIGYEELTVYKSDDYTVQYHDTAEEIKANMSNGTWLPGRHGKLQYIEWNDVSNQVVYYKPGTYAYGSKTWVPTYMDSVLLQNAERVKNSSE
jgi:hypothetical protein